LFYPRNVKWLIFLLFFLSNYRNMIILSWKQIMIFWGMNCSLFYPRNYFFSVKKTNYDILRRLAEPQSSARIKALRCCAAWHRISPQIGSRELSGQEKVSVNKSKSRDGQPTISPPLSHVTKERQHQYKVEIFKYYNY
jgi:hypothetical protein